MSTHVSTPQFYLALQWLNQLFLTVQLYCFSFYLDAIKRRLESKTFSFISSLSNCKLQLESNFQVLKSSRKQYSLSHLNIYTITIPMQWRYFSKVGFTFLLLLSPFAYRYSQSYFALTCLDNKSRSLKISITSLLNTCNIIPYLCKNSS